MLEMWNKVTLLWRKLCDSSAQKTNYFLFQLLTLKLIPFLSQHISKSDNDRPLELAMHL